MKPSMTSLITVTIILLMLSVVLNILSIMVINNLNINTINGVLYDYGLTFSTDWAGKYGGYLNLLFGSAGLSIVLICIAAASSFILGKTKDNNSRLFGYLTLALGAAANFLSIIAFLLMDQTVNSDFYSYGLTFSLNWYEPYFVQSNLFLTIEVFAVSLILISFILVLLTKPSTIKFDSQKIISLFLIIIGVFLIAFSMVYSSTDALPTPALVGLGMIFWGMIVGYISSEEYIKREVFQATNLSYLSTLNEMMQKIQLDGTVVFLPIQYLRGPKTNNVYLAKYKKIELRNIKELLQKAARNQKLKESLMLAPGNELLRLFERILGKSFANADYSFFEINIPKLLINELEIAQDIKIEAEENIVKVKVKNLVTSDFSREMNEYKDVTDSVGTPLASAIASALANSTNTPVVINNYKMSVDKNTVEIQYQFIKDEGVRFR